MMGILNTDIGGQISTLPHLADQFLIDKRCLPVSQRS
jgi:hypothetical protein